MNQPKIQGFNKLVEKNLTSLLRFAYSRCNNRELAEDLVQDTCLKAYKAFVNEGQEIIKFKEWIFRILINTHISFLRKKRIENFCDYDTNKLEDDEILTDPIRSNEIKEDINLALSFLNEEQRTVIYLVEIEGYSFKEAAEILGIPFGTLASRLQRGKIKLRSLLSDMGYEKGYAKAGNKQNALQTN